MNQVIRLTLFIILLSSTVHARGGQSELEETEDRYTQFNKGIVMDRHMKSEDAETIMQKGKYHFNSNETERPNITVSKRATIINNRNRQTQISQTENHFDKQTTRTNQRSFHQMSIRVKRTTNSSHYANNQKNPSRYQ